MAANAQEIANAYLALTVKMPGVQKDIESALGNVDTGKTGRGMGGKLMGGLKVGAVGAAATVAAGVIGTLGVALTKGFGRLESLDQATAKLTGLGHSAESVQSIMNNALASVRGTAFGMDEAATVAAGVVASGIRPGEELQRVLSLVADTATIAGTSMGDMGAIFNKVAAGGVLQGEEIAQLGDRGIPILQFLAEELGVTAQEAKDLASEGKVSFETFASAMEAGLGGAAQSSGETFSGALANVNASLGRIGAGLLGGAFDELAPTFQAITESLGPLETVAASVGEDIGEFLTPAFEGLRSLLDGGFDFSQFGELLSYFSPLGLVFKALEPVLPQIAEMLGEVFDVLGGAMGQILPVLLPVLSSIVAVFAEFLAAVLPPILPLITMLAEIIGDVLLAVLPLLEPLGELVAAIFPVLATVIGALMPIVEGVVNAFSTLLMPVVDTLVAVLGGLIEFLTGVFTGDWEKAWGGVVQIFTGLWEGMQAIGLSVINALIDLVNGFLGTLNEVGNFAADITGGAITWEIPEIPHLEGPNSTPGNIPTSPSTVPVPRADRTAFAGVPGSGGPLVVVNPGPGMDETVIGQVAGARAARELTSGV